jgi:hypothetical protein
MQEARRVARPGAPLVIVVFGKPEDTEAVAYIAALGSLLPPPPPGVPGPFALSTDGAPTIYIDGIPAQNQGFSSDAINFYVWGETPFSTHQIEIVFAATAPTVTPPERTLFQSIGIVEIAILALTSILVASAVIAISLNKRRQKTKMG